MRRKVRPSPYKKIVWTSKLKVGLKNQESGGARLAAEDLGTVGTQGAAKPCLPTVSKPEAAVRRNSFPL